VDDEEIASAILMLLSIEKTLEGAGARTGGAVQSKTNLRHRRRVWSRGNIDVTLLAEIIDAPGEDGRLLRIRISPADGPAAAGLTKIWPGSAPTASRRSTIGLLRR